MKFSEYLVEIMKSAKPDFNDYRIGTTDKYVYDFEHKDRKFSVIFERDDPETMEGPQSIWSVSYTFRKGAGQSSYAMQNFNDSSAFGIMSTVFGYVLMFAESLSPDEIYFAADKGDGSRVGVYSRIMKRVFPDLKRAGYGYIIVDKKYQHQFTIRKTEFLKDTPDAHI